MPAEEIPTRVEEGTLRRAGGPLRGPEQNRQRTAQNGDPKEGPFGAWERPPERGEDTSERGYSYAERWFAVGERRIAHLAGIVQLCCTTDGSMHAVWGAIVTVVAGRAWKLSEIPQQGGGTT